MQGFEPNLAQDRVHHDEKTHSWNVQSVKTKRVLKVIFTYRLERRLLQIFPFVGQDLCLGQSFPG